MVIVEKFGGTSVGSVERISAVADHLMKKKASGESLVVVVSAMSGETNRLVSLAEQISGDRSNREMDVLLSTERASYYRIAVYGLTTAW